MTITINGTGTITGINAGGLPDAIITQAELATGVAGTGPAFSAYQSIAQALSAATFTKITFDVEDFDTNNNFASSRFTPTIAGYYQINGRVQNTTGTGQTAISIYKNGSQFRDGNNLYGPAVAVGVSTLIYLNGSTDYVEIYGYFATAGNTSNAQTVTYFSGSMVRSA
jgi:hypothetical protein